MKPSHYLNYGSGLVFLILGSIVAMSWFASDQVGGQQSAYVEQQLQLQQLDSMRTSIHRIVSSTNEFALIALANAVGAASGSAAIRETASEDGGVPPALEHESKLIKAAVNEFEQSFAALQAQREQSQPGSETVKSLRTGFQELLELNGELLATIGAAETNTGEIFELKEKQESFETKLLDGIGAQQKIVQDTIQTRGGMLTADLNRMKNVSLIAGLAAALILLASTVFVSRRVGDMFAQIGDQRQSIKNANHDLNAAMASLQSLQQDLVSKEKFATLGRLTATVSHELRNPLAAIRNSAFIIRQGVAHLPEMTDFVTRIERNIARCDHIIADLLEYTRTREMDKYQLDLCAWLESLAREQDLPPSVSLILDLETGSVLANIDETRFRRVIVNLVENATQAIVATEKPGTIKITCNTQTGGAVITVADDGPGIADDIAARIFEPLFTTKNFGAGLGLSIAQSLVSQHGGTIGLETQPGKGAAFSIRLPLYDHPQQHTAAA